MSFGDEADEEESELRAGGLLCLLLLTCSHSDCWPLVRTMVSCRADHTNSCPTAMASSGPKIMSSHDLLDDEHLLKDTAEEVAQPKLREVNKVPSPRHKYLDHESGLTEFYLHF